MSMKPIEYIQTFFWEITALGVGLTWKVFQANQKLKRAEWLKSLYEKFYENDQYKPVRKWIDFKLLEDHLAFDNDAGHENEEKLSDFLNFFEFIGTLEKMKQLKVVEIKDLFEYYLNQIRQSDRCMTYIDTYKFKNLKLLLYQSFNNEK